MAIYDKEGQLTYKDEAGNSYLLHPKTKMNCVDGLEEALGEKAPASHAESKNNPHGVSADQVGARPNTWMPTASDVGAPTMAYTRRVGNPRNLLDNSDFRNPVNQRGLTSYTGRLGTMYTIDRWKRTNFDCTVAIVSGENGKGIKFTSTSDNLPEFQQLLEPGTIIPGKTYTLACELLDGSIHVCKGEAEADGYNVLFINTEKNQTIGFKEGVVNIRHYEPGTTEIKWMALYEGEYTAETLPEYQPKGYAAELAECQQYYCRLDTAGGGVYGIVLNGMITAGNKDIVLSLPIRKMRLSRPAVAHSGLAIIRGVDGYIEDSQNGIHVSLAVLGTGYGHNLRVNKNDGSVFSINAKNNTPVSMSFTVGAYIEFSADL